MPSSLVSTTAGRPVLATASAGDGALAASIGRTGWPTRSETASSPARPEVASTTAAAAVEPSSIAARRRVVAGTSYASATPSCTSESSAPWRTSSNTRPRSSRCSASVARANSSATAPDRRAADPGPATPARRSKAESTSRTVSSGAGAGAGRSPREAQPTPVRRWRSVPERYVTTSSSSAGRPSSVGVAGGAATSRTAAAIAARLAIRDDVAATAADVSASLANSTGSSWRTPPTGRHRREETMAAAPGRWRRDPRHLGASSGRAPGRAGAARGVRVRVVPRRPAADRRAGGGRAGQRRADAHRWREVAVLPAPGAAATWRRRRRVASHRPDARPGGGPAAAGRARRVLELHLDSGAGRAGPP